MSKTLTFNLGKADEVSAYGNVIQEYQYKGIRYKLEQDGVLVHVILL